MANSQLINKLQRELKRNPKKTAILALGLLMAGYFWAPLLAGWFGGGDTKPKKPKPTTVAATTPDARTVAEGSPAATPPVEELDWESMLQWIQEDPHMVSAQLEQQQRNPFQSIPEEITSQLEFVDAEPIEETEEPAFAVAEVTTPQSAGLVLSSTVVAGNGGWARISGESYRPGIKVYVGEVDKNDPVALAATMSFTLEEIHETYVVLSRDGEIYRLEMPRPALSSGGRIRFNEM